MMIFQELFLLDLMLNAHPDAKVFKSLSMEIWFIEMIHQYALLLFTLVLSQIKMEENSLLVLKMEYLIMVKLQLLILNPHHGLEIKLGQEVLLLINIENYVLKATWLMDN